MSTPTPPHPPHLPSSASKHATFAAHAVSTPINHHGPSQTSTPRSVPSPAMTRTNAAKTPSNTTAPNTNRTPGGGSGGAAMAHSLSQMSTGSGHSSGPSPAGAAGLGISSINNLGMGMNMGMGMGTGMGGLAGVGVSPNALLNFASPAGLAGLDMSTPGGGNLLDPSAGGHAMGITLSDLGLSSQGVVAVKRDEDEERRVRLEGVLSRLMGSRKNRFGHPAMGRVSDEGVRRVGRWAGFDVEVEAKWEAKEFEGERPMIIAGKNAFLIDLTFKHNLPQHVEITFASESEAVKAHQADAAKVLLDDLKPEDGAAAINTKLDRFAADLESLARLDRLSTQGLDCFEAITGVYTSLKRLYEHEKEAAKAILDGNSPMREEVAERQVMCSKSGHPRMHARGKIGMSLEYWTKTQVFGQSERDNQGTQKDEDAMDLDNSPEKQELEDDVQPYLLEITAEPSVPDLYPPLRTTPDWLSDRIVKPTEETTDPSDLLSGKPSIDWLDPPPTYLTQSDNQDENLAVDGITQQRLPNARFVANLRPPLVMPWNVAGQILQSAGLTSMPTTEHLASYEAMLLQHHGKPQHDIRSGSIFSATNCTSVIDRNGESREATHTNSLYVPKQDYAYLLEAIPFAHPRQLIQVLPILRQWAFLGDLLINAFSHTPVLASAPSATKSVSLPAAAVAAKPQPLQIIPAKRKASPTDEDEDRDDDGMAQIPLSDLLTPPPDESEDSTANSAQIHQRQEAAAATVRRMQKRLPIDITLATSPAPALTLLFPLRAAATAAAAASGGGIGERLAHVSVSILPDGEVMVTGQNVVGDDAKVGLPKGTSDVNGGSGGGMDESEGGGAEGEAGAGAGGQQDGPGEEVGKEIMRIARALGLCGDVGIWVEWIRERF